MARLTRRTWPLLVAVLCACTGPGAPRANPPSTLLLPGGGTPALASPGPATYTVVDAGTGVSRVVPSSLPMSAFYLYPFLVRQGGTVAVVGSQKGPYDPAIGTAYALDPGLDAAPVPLGPASAVYPAVQADRVWLYTDNATPDQRIHGSVTFGDHRTVTEVDLHGNVTSPERPIPAGRSPIAGVEGGLLTLSQPSSTDFSVSYLEVWDPATGKVVRRISDVATPPPMAASPRYVAWGPESCTTPCDLRVTDVVTGKQRLIRQPNGASWDSATFSPDSRLLALTSHPTSSTGKEGPGGPPGFVPSGSTTAQLVVFDPATGEKRASRSISAWVGGTRMAWSLSSAWLFVVADVDRIAAYPADLSAPARTVRVPGGAPEFLATT